MKKKSLKKQKHSHESIRILTSSSRVLEVLNPYTEEVIAKVSDATEKELDNAVNLAREAFNSWKLVTPSERSLLFLKLANLIEQEAENIALLERENTGKLLSSAREELKFAIDNIRFFASACRCMNAQASGQYSKESTSIVKREPLGVVAAIVPWNYPFLIACWKLAALAAGNTLIIKPSSYTPLSALELLRLAEKAGFPKNVLQVITGTGDRLGTLIAINNGIDAISFTGSSETGKEIMKLASENLKKIILELGGKAPFVVFDDADINKAAENAVNASTYNSGQDCTAAARIYVQENIYEQFIKSIRKKASEFVLGDPLKPQTKIGPLISPKQAEKVKSFLKTLEPEEEIVYQSQTPKRGFFAPLTIIKNMKQKSPLCQKEIFGPIIAIGKFKTEQEAIEKANDTKYGLSSSIWTSDIKKAFRVANALRFGEVWLNEHLPLVSEMPHSGLKHSGSGVDLSIHALEEFTYLKHIFVSHI